MPKQIESRGKPQQTPLSVLGRDLDRYYCIFLLSLEREVKYRRLSCYVLKPWFIYVFIYLQMFIQDSHFSENTVFQMRPVDYNVNM